MRNFLLFCAGLSILACQSQPKSLPVTESGYEYEHHIQNEGVKPQTGDEVTYHQWVYKNDSLLFSTMERGQPVKGVLPERSTLPKPVRPDFEAVFLMSKGDSMSLYQRLDSIPNLPPGFTKDDVIRYEVSLVDIKPAAKVLEEQAAIKGQESAIAASTKTLIEDYNAGKLKGKLTTTDSGLKYIIHEEGTGVSPSVEDYVVVNYYGALTDGKMFDNSYQRGEATGFMLGQVIQGWQEGIALLKEGAKATFFIPYELGYGEAGSPPDIPEKAELVFYVELVEVIKTNS